MTVRRRNAHLAGATLLLCAASLLGSACSAQRAAEAPGVQLPVASDLGLDAGAAAELNKALEQRDYPAAERVLLPRVAAAGKTEHAAQLLAYTGGVYYLAGDPLHAAIAWNKARAIAPLPEPLEFSLAMAYVRMGRPDWARKQLETLAAAHPRAALYPYWLGRLQYDALQYSAAAVYFRQAIQLDPAMARAYDNLGLCLFSENRNSEAVVDYRKAIALEAGVVHPSPWPHINLAAALQWMGRNDEAESELQTALSLDANNAPAHFALGGILETQGQQEAALREFETAATLDPQYAEPHVAMARVYRKLGRLADARAQVAVYTRLRNAARTQAGHASQP